MITYEDLTPRADADDVVKRAELDDVKLIFYIVCGVFSGALLILIGCVIGLYAWINKILNSQKNNNILYNTSFSTFGRTIKPNEELAKRYTMSGEDGKSLHENPTLDRNPLSRQASFKKPEPDILGNVKEKNNKNNPGLKKHSEKRREPPSRKPVDGMHFAEDRMRDDLFY